MELPAYFISDAHLGIEPSGCMPGRESKLVQLLESLLGAASHVVIAGDLFEFWYEYRYYVASAHMDLYRVLADLVKSGVQVHLLRGNHDFAYGNFFPKNLGVQVHRDLQLEIQNKRIYCVHGDGVAKSDRGYRLMRHVLDFPLNRFLFRQLHPDWGMALARKVGQSSRKLGATREIDMPEYLAWGNSTLKKYHCDFCILGHHHIPGLWNVDHGVVASPGEWIWKPSYLKLQDGALSLVRL